MGTEWIEIRVVGGRRVRVNRVTLDHATGLATAAYINGLSLAQAKEILDQEWGELAFPERDGGHP